MAVEYIGDGNPSGTSVGRTSTELVGFHGSVSDQAANISLATGATIATVVTAVQAILAALEEKGVHASS